ncbi:MAG: fibronectin type III-like domain-contianing protein, partial [Cyclobacteriaceae bacterium]
GESKEVTFNVTQEDLAFYNLEMQRVVEPGDFFLMVGGSSENEDLKTAKLTVK